MNDFIKKYKMFTGSNFNKNLLEMKSRKISPLLLDNLNKHNYFRLFTISFKKKVKEIPISK